MDIFSRFARDPACLVAIDATDGGRWRSPFRPGVVYPATPTGGGSFEEQTGLIKKINIDPGFGDFRAANPSIPARIDTPLDLRGRVSSYTSVVRFTAANLTADSQKQELTGQGACIGSNLSFCAMAYYRSYGLHYIQLTTEIGGTRQLTNVAISPLSGIHVVSGVIDVRTSQTILSIYLDGALIKTQTMTGIPYGSSSAVVNFSVNDNRYGVWTNFFGKFHNVLLFDRVFSSGQIQILR